MKFMACLNELVQNIVHPALVFDHNLRVILTNSIEAPAWNLASANVLGKTAFDFFPSEQAILLHDSCLKAMESKEPVIHRLKLQRSEDFIEPTAKLIPVFNPDSKSWNLICLIEDKCSGGAVSDTEEAYIKDICGQNVGKTEGAASISEAKAALRFLLKEGAAQLAELKEAMRIELASKILPHVEALKESRLDQDQRVYADLLETSVKSFSEPFARRISDPLYNLSPMEMKISRLIRGGKTNKEIAKLLNLSKSTILTHRHHVRTKLGLKNKKRNLQSYLIALGAQLNFVPDKQRSQKRSDHTSQESNQ